MLDILPGAPTKDIKATYRRKSLLIHPDKCNDPRAPDAFDRLKKAEADLMDEEKRADLDRHFAEARRIIITRTKCADNCQEDWFYRDVRVMVKELLIEEELAKRRQKRTKMAAEGREKAQAEAKVEAAKRKRDEQKEWEDTRDTRINSWRDFQKKKKRGK